MFNYTNNITLRYVTPAEDYILTHWTQSEKATFLQRQIFSRICHLGLAPLSAITCVVDTIIGMGGTIPSILTVGKNADIVQSTTDYISSSKLIVAKPYAHLLRALNPSAPMYYSISNSSFVDRYFLRLSKCKDALIIRDGDGFITHYASNALKNFARGCYNSDHFFKRHITSRLTYALLAMSSVITRIADAIIGCVAAPLAFLTIGKVESINNLAYRTLQAPGIVKDLFYCSVKFINPWTGT